MIRRGAAAVLLAALLYAGFRFTGPVPPLGSLLDPANGAWAHAGASELPPLQSIDVPGFDSTVRVLFDDRGVPHIFAATELDAYRALGYVVARDRLFQMEIQTRATAGTLTEWAGPRALPVDRDARALGLARAAERKFLEYDRESPGFKAITAYAEGVNAWIARMRPRDIPIEYRLLGKQPMRWEPLHSLYFLSRMSLTLAMNDATLKRLRAERLVGKEAADQLYPVNSPIQEPIQPNGLGGPRYDFGVFASPGAPDSTRVVALEARERLHAMLDLGSRVDAGDALGSNNWAVSPSRSSTGHALLAGDPHLELTLPSIWYEAHIVVPGKLDVAGAGFPGVPGVVIGFNRNVAWTFTNTGSDVSDFYAEVVDDTTRPSRYMLDGQWKDLEKRVEEYRNERGRVIATDTLLFTHRGPLQKIAGSWLSMRWTLYEPSHELDNFLSLGYSKDVNDWLNAMNDFVVPTQNGLVADRAGNIVIRSTGMYPIRPGDGRGDVIRDGSTSASDWRGSLPLAMQPFAMNPAQGFLASANQQPVDPAQNSRYMGSDWYSPWRALHINRLLRANASVTPDDMRQYQTDAGNARADAFAPIFLAAAESEQNAGRGDADLKEAARLLGEWDRRYDPDNHRAVLFEAAMTELALRTWDELVDHSDTAATRRAGYPEPQMLLKLTRFPASAWWDDRTTAGVEDRDAIFAASLRAAYSKVLSEKGSPSSSGWLWSNNRHANIHHLLRIRAFSSPGIPIQAGPGTLSPSSGSGTHGASWRMVVELGPEIRAWAVYPGGQSGAPSSSRYRDRLSRWTLGQLEPVLYPATIEEMDRKRVVSTLNIRP